MADRHRWCKAAATLLLTGLGVVGVARAEDNDSALSGYADILHQMQTGQMGLDGSDPAAKVKLPPGWKLVHRAGNKGFWFLIEGSKPNASKCALMFGQNDNMFVMASPNGKGASVAIYTGPGVDAPAGEPERVELEMRLNGQTARAPFFWMPSGQQGFFITPIKLYESVKGIEDRGDFEMSLNGKTVLVAATEGGFKARDAMLACMAKNKLR